MISLRCTIALQIAGIQVAAIQAAAMMLCAGEAPAQQPDTEITAAPPTATIRVLGFERNSPFATWQDTGLYLRQGDTLHVKAAGETSWQGDPNNEVYGPDGTGTPGPQPQSMLLPGVSFMSLIGKVGDELIDANDYESGEPTKGAGLLGAQTTWTKQSEGEGRLYLAINDGQDLDNTGEYTVKLRLMRDGKLLDNSVQRPVGSPVEPIPPIDKLEGQEIFHGAYRHYVRGQQYGAAGETWIHEAEDGGLRIVAHLPFFGETSYVETNATFRPVEFALMRSAVGQLAPFEARVKFSGEQAIQSKYSPGDIVEAAGFAIDPEGYFDYNARPDAYALAPVLARLIELKEGATRELAMYDWGLGDEGPGSFPEYRVRLEVRGREAVAVPAGRFEAYRLLLTQLSTADTFFRKEEGHTTEYWVLENHVVVRVARHREPYEIQLSAIENVEALPGYLGEASVVPVYMQRHDHGAAGEGGGHEHHEHD